jgi:NAD(P)-dependent dehydrogenase (short-subunit alcohol dehydrogenase family)
MTSNTIVTTGASDGIGAAAARRLSRKGDKVVVVGRSESKTVAVAEELAADYFTRSAGSPKPIVRPTIPALPDSCGIARWAGSHNE